MVKDNKTYLTKISFSQAQKIITATANDLFQSSAEVVSSRQCLNRVLATDLHAKINVPAFDKSAMDGYAIRISDISI